MVSKFPIELEAKFDAKSGFHLTETPICENQKLTPQDDGGYLLNASLPDTSQLRWWLLGFGDGVEVLSPKSLRKEFKEIFNTLGSIYE